MYLFIAMAVFLAGMLVLTFEIMEEDKAKKAENGQEQLKNLARESSYDLGTIRRIDIESIWKFTLSISCGMDMVPITDD